MTNILVSLPAVSGAVAAGGAGGSGDRYVMVAAHYDTKKFDTFTFVGANDGGSGSGALMELARALLAQPRRPNVLLAFLDGEEAVREWSGTDSLYGSRYLAESLQGQNRLSQVKAFILMDMIGSRHLSIQRIANSTAWLQERIWKTAERLNLSPFFSQESFPIEDDHLPFLERAVPSVVLIDFRYGPGGTSNAYWHTAQDTLDKLSPQSLDVVGRVVEATVLTIDP